jgi:undecaprenyl-diphosphatase
LLMGALFLHLGSEIAEGETRRFDVFVLDAGRALRAAHPWMADVMRDLSGLGSAITLALVTLGACGYLAVTRSWATAAIVATAAVSGAVAVALFKAGFARARPDSQLAQIVVDGASYPSGHSSMAAVVYLTLGALIARMRERRVEKVYILGAAGMLAFLVGVSRAAMGVHWATDVAGGWALGIAWAAACIFAVRWAD